MDNKWSAMTLWTQVEHNFINIILTQIRTTFVSSGKVVERNIWDPIVSGVYKSKVLNDLLLWNKLTPEIDTNNVVYTSLWKLCISFSKVGWVGLTLKGGQSVHY